MQLRSTRHLRKHERGASILEIVIVVTISTILGAVAIPQLVTARRVLRSSLIPRQVLSQLRLVRQEAMSQRQAMTFQYDGANKQIVVIDHQASGRALLTATGYPDTAGSTRVRTIPLAGSGITAGEISYGIPAGLPVAAQGALGDNTTLTALPANNRINITFQPDGSIIDTNGNPVNFALYFYNVSAATQTATAVSILGSGGRVKTWRYDTNAGSYVE